MESIRKYEVIIFVQNVIEKYTNYRYLNYMQITYSKSQKPTVQISRTKLKAPVIFIFPDYKQNTCLLKKFQAIKKCIKEITTVLPNLFQKKKINSMEQSLNSFLWFSLRNNYFHQNVMLYIYPIMFSHIIIYRQDNN